MRARLIIVFYRSACIMHFMRENYLDVIASEVRAGLARLGYTQEILGTQLNLSRAAIHRRLSGEVQFRISELMATAEFLQVPLASLISFSPNQSSPAVRLTPQAEPAGDSFITEGAA